VQLTVTVPAAASCSQAIWTTTAFTGNNVGGSPFNYVGAPPTTSNFSGCSLAFQKQPANAKVNTTITSVSQDPAGAPVQVAVVDASSSVQAWFTGTITLTNAGPGTGTLSGGTGMNAISGVATFPALELDTAGLYALKAGASGFTSVNSNQFTIFSGELQCGDPLDPGFTNPQGVAPDQPGYSTGNRGKYNKDGSTCIKVPYTFTNTILVDNTVHLSWDTGIQPSPTFLYSMNWQPRNVEPATTGNPSSANPLAGWTIMPRPLVAWLNTDGTSVSIPGTPAYVPGLACLSGKLPAPYGTLGTGVTIDNTSNPAAFTVTGIAAYTAVGLPTPAAPHPAPMPSLVGAPALPSAPFPIVIGNSDGAGAERMTVTSIANQSPPTSPGYTGTYTMTFNVTRGTVTEGFWPLATHTGTTTSVMSTPLPLIPNDTTTFPAPYIVQRQAQMCIAEHGFDAFTIGPGGTAQIMYFTSVIDIGDGWVGLR
jgi:hypothetical protein